MPTSKRKTATTKQVSPKKLTTTKARKSTAKARPIKRQIYNALYGQSGGVTPVINATGATCIEALQKASGVEQIYGAKNGILGILREQLFDVTNISAGKLDKISQTPGAYFGSCRYKLDDINTKDKKRHEEFRRIIEVFRTHNIRYFFYNGGNDSSDTCMKISQVASQMGYNLKAIHLPKTIDNDLFGTDCSPGYGSTAKYLATSCLEAALDVEAMCESSTKVFLFEVMGRHTGWLAGAGAAGLKASDMPFIVLFPEIPFVQKQVMRLIKEKVKTYGFVNVVISEGIRDSRNRLIAGSSSRDSFGHQQLGGCAYTLAEMVQKNLGYKHHCAVPDYLQRSASHLMSATDYKHCQALSNKAVQLALAGKNQIMVAIERLSNSPYRWRVGSVNLAKVANKEKKVPTRFISSDGYGITEDFIQYLLPLMQGERYPAYTKGIPRYLRRKNAKQAKPLLKPWRG